MKKALFAALIALFLAAPAWAKTEITVPDAFTQDMFKDLSRDLGLAISYVPLATAEPLGGVLPGLDAGVEVTSVSIDKNQQYWKDVEKASGGSIPSIMPFPKLHIQVGLPVIPIDLGYVYATLPSTNIKYMGGELKWAILSGSAVTPAVAIRGAYTKLSGVENLDISTKSADISISKGFAMFTPYAGYMMVWIDAKDKRPVTATLTKDLEDVSESEGKAFVGFKLTFFPLMNLVAEADFAKVKSYSARLNVHF